RFRCPTERSESRTRATTTSPIWTRSPRRCPSCLLVRKLDAEQRQHNEQRNACDGRRHHEPWMTGAAEGLPADLPPEDGHPGDRRQTYHEHGREQDRPLERQIGHPHGHDDDSRDRGRSREVADAHRTSVSRGYPRCVATEANYESGEDYIVEFDRFRFGFNSSDFEERVTAAAVKLGLVADNELDDDETADLVELVERDWIESPRSGLGQYIVRHWERVSLVGGESLVYWLKKLVFRGAWLDHRVKEGLLEV